MANEGWLTCEVVEQIQQAAQASRPVDNFVETLKAATLSGMVEYGCARWQYKALPPLPPAISQSAIGQSLLDVKSDLGLRSDGLQRIPPRTLAPHSSEFILLEGQESTVHRDWREFLVRFCQSAKHVGFTKNQAKGLAASLGEMADNAAYHANAPTGVLVGYQAIDGATVCCIADVGDGVLKSLKTNSAYQHLRHHKEAIRVALRQGESRFGPGSGGLGFYRVFKSLAEMWGTLRFRSGEGCILMDGREFKEDHGEESYVVFRPGFQISIGCRTSNQNKSVPLI